MNKPHTTWAHHLPASSAYTPSRALLGYEIPLPGDKDLEGPRSQPEAPVHEHCEERLEDIRRHVLTYQTRYDGGEAPEPFVVGDQVMVRAHAQSDAKKSFMQASIRNGWGHTT